MPFMTRFDMARDAGLDLPDGPIAIWGASPDTQLPDIADLHVISPDARVHDRFSNATRHAPDSVAAAIVIVPREKARAQAWLADAAKATQGPLIIDGQKTDGIDPILKAIKKLGEVDGQMSKAHGRIFWCSTAPDLADWAAKALEVDGLQSWPGVFSANRVDAGSRLLAEALPAKLGTSVADLGAGWGWLSAQIVQDGRELHMVEVDADALDCAKVNVPDAVAHWADVTRWQHPRLFDSVVMNPPFHEGRKGTPDLGQAFIQKAAEILKPSGQLFMVANRHLPYEAALGTLFGHVEELAGDGRFKLFRATRPSRRRR